MLRRNNHIETTAILVHLGHNLLTPCDVTASCFCVGMTPSSSTMLFMMMFTYAYNNNSIDIHVQMTKKMLSTFHYAIYAGTKQSAK